MQGFAGALGDFLTPGQKCLQTASPLPIQTRTVACWECPEPAIRYRAPREVEFELVNSAFDLGGCQARSLETVFWIDCRPEKSRIFAGRG